MAAKITLATIAEQLNLSTATVSLALRNSELIANTTKTRVKMMAAELGYIYNRRAASLRTSKSGIIGVLVHDIMNPFFAEILLAIEEELGQNQQTFLLCNHHDKIRFQTQFVETLLQFGADGVILSPAIGTTFQDIDRIKKNNLPIVMIARSIPKSDVPSFRGDDRAGVYLATRHLIQLGHKRIAFIGGKRSTSTGRDRRAGYLAALEEARIAPEPELQMGSESTRKAGYDSVRLMFNSNLVRPTAIVCFNDLVAIGVMSGLRDLGLEPGKDVSVTGYDDISEAEIAAPALTTVWNGQQQVGQRAAQTIIALANGKNVDTDRVLITPELRPRASTRPPKSA